MRLSALFSPILLGVLGRVCVSISIAVCAHLQQGEMREGEGAKEEMLILWGRGDSIQNDTRWLTAILSTSDPLPTA